MEYDYEGLHAKTAEIRGHLLELANDDVVADEIIKKAISLTPPEQPEMICNLVVIGSFSEGARSRKLGNIALDWKNLVELGASMPLLASSISKAPPWACIFMALGLIMRLLRLAEKELGEIEASILYALWTNRGQDRKISENDGYKKTNALRKKVGQATLSRDVFDEAINKLLKIKCVGMEDGIIRLRERVIITYG